MEVTGKLDELGDARCDETESREDRRRKREESEEYGEGLGGLARASTCNVHITELRIWRVVFMNFDIFMIEA